MENTKFISFDANMAAYLIVSGIEYFGVQKNEEGKCIFVFSKDEKTMEAFSRFRNDTWLKNYNQARKECLNSIKDIRNQNQA